MIPWPHPTDPPPRAKGYVASVEFMAGFAAGTIGLLLVAGFIAYWR